jgi:hypothetical protein
VSRSVVIIGAIVAILALVTAAVLFTTGNQSLERLGLLIGLVAPSLAALLALARSDQAARSTDATSGIAEALNGNFDARVRNAIRHVIDEGPTKSGAPARSEPISVADHDVISKPTNVGR